ncbi:hypothetical protein V6N12_049106 [Hibiscus sabdariffa]|uniref:Uncharacterized protein n=1 Tax=Hibiscus sabdariffa TaxID=183260 RepID=A0ABR2EKR6_9ROSI
MKKELMSSKSKHAFGNDSIDYLELVMTHQGLMLVSTKVVTIKAWSTPASVEKEPKVMKGKGASHNLLKSCKCGKHFPAPGVINIDHDESDQMDDLEFCVERGSDFNSDASLRKKLSC